MDNLLKSKLNFKGQVYDVCKNGCKLYDPNDSTEHCEHCNEKRFEHNKPEKPKAVMNILSIGECLAQMLADTNTNQLLKYRSERENIPGEFSDIFDGQNYKDLLQKGFFSNPNDIAIGIFTDGFVNAKKGKASYTIVHVVVFNFDPSLRYYNTIHVYRINIL